MLAPTEGSRSGVVTGPSQTQSAETLPEIVSFAISGTGLRAPLYRLASAD
jgi:hypothetical protein